MQARALTRFLTALIDQGRARVLVPAYRPSTGHWFGGGNLIQLADGTLLLSGRYRNYGDSRTGLGAGERGLECAVFASEDRGRTFRKIVSFSKADLSQSGAEVVSIEGTSLHALLDGSIELFVSSEKDIPYPDGLAEYQKPGTGVWSIDRIAAPSVSSLDPARMEPVIANHDLPEYLHVKDPSVFNMPDGDTGLIFCSHPFTWASSNTGLAIRRSGASPFDIVDWEAASRGPTWDIAATRVTGRLAVPALGAFADGPPRFVYFYDGAECLRKLDENPNARRRPRGYSCEELGGAFVGGPLPTRDMQRLSRLAPLFVSPYGTGSSRYVSTLTLEEGILAIWQQSQPDESQPLVGHVLPMNEVERLLRPG
ncbi:MAG: exo-alpha-sialidase [Chloroflexi bacterium]|nr:exo-alpha-sialidase [Chloroflexota bacterium]